MARQRAAVKPPRAERAKLEYETHVITRRDLTVAGGLFAGFVILGLVTDSAYNRHLLILGCLYAILIMTQNLVTGYMGLLHLAHAAFFGLGAYGSALVAMRLGVPVLLAYFVGVAIAAVAGAIVGALSIRFGGHYLAIVSLGFGVIVYQMLNNFVELTRGPHGLTGIPPPPPVGPVEWTLLTHLVVATAAMCLVLLFLSALRRSKLGIYMDAVRADIVAAKAIGINTTRVKVTGYVIAASIAGGAGAMFAHYRRIISPELYTFLESATILAMTVLGGLRSYLGSIAAAFFFVVVPEVLRGLQEWRLILYGALLVIVVLYFPRGLAGVAELGWRWLRRGASFVGQQLPWGQGGSA